MFTATFPKYACEGDSISCEVEGYTITARIVRDDCSDKPDERQDGFWPSRDKNAAGYVPPGSFDIEMAKAQEAMRAWKADEWFYCGVVLEVSRNDVMLEKHAASLWGIECNYPHSADNGYLVIVANELLPEALAQGKAIRAKLLA